MSEVELRSIYLVPEAEKILYEILRERSSEKDQNVNISHKLLPTWAEHVAYVAKRPYRYWYLVYNQGSPVGTCYLTKLNEIGVFIFNQARGRGFGFKSVAALVQNHTPLPETKGKRSGSFIANINPKNSRSIKLFEKLGFTQKQIIYEL
jgi:RimJ/RimL family protein N-acetyltransferase